MDGKLVVRDFVKEHTHVLLMLSSTQQVSEI